MTTPTKEQIVIPTQEQVMQIKQTSLKMYMNVSKQTILRVILEWEKIRGK